MNDIFAKSEYLGATNNSKKRKIQYAITIYQVQAAYTKPGPIVGFTEKDTKGVGFSHDDALVVFVQLACVIVGITMVNSINVLNLLRLSNIQTMGLESMIIRQAKVLTRYNGHTSTVIDNITLNVRTPPVVSKQKFTIVSDSSPYNGILGKPWLVKLGILTSIEY